MEALMTAPNLERLLTLAADFAKEEEPEAAEVAGVALDLARAYTLIGEALEPLKDILRGHTEELLQED